MDPMYVFKVMRIKISEDHHGNFFVNPSFNTSEKKTMKVVLKYSCTAICIFNDILLICIHSKSQEPNLRICNELSKLYTIY